MRTEINLRIALMLWCLSGPIFSQQHAEEDAQNLYDEILSLPGWQDGKEEEPMSVENFRMYFDVAEKVRRIDHRTLSLLLDKLFVAAAGDDGAEHETRPYILFRVLFDVTDNVRLKPAVKWADNNPTEGILYPLTVDPGGKLRVGFPYRGRDGASYNPEYDYNMLSVIFKDRDLKKAKP